jgi:hypothetical protein
MAQVTYRGVSYDTEQYKEKIIAEQTAKQRFDLMYRGTRVNRKVVTDAKTA